MRGAYMTCTGMCGSGVRIGIMIVIMERRQTGARGKVVEDHTGCVAAVRGSPMPTTSAPPTATGSRPSFATTSTASVLWRLRGLSSLCCFDPRECRRLNLLDVVQLILKVLRV